MTAGVVAVPHRRGVLAPGRILNGQRINISTDEECLAGSSTFEHRDHSGSADPFLHSETKRAQPPGEGRGCPDLPKGELRVTMELAAQVNQGRC